MKQVFVKSTTVFILIIAGFLGYVALSSHYGRSRAEALCQTIPVGTEAQRAQALISSAGNDPWLYFSSPERIGNGFYGAFKERWICSIAISDGRVVGNEIRLID